MIVMRSPLARAVLLAFVLPFGCNDTIPDFANKGVTMQLFLGAVPIILRLFSKAGGHLYIILKLFPE